MDAMPFASLNSDIFKIFLILCTAPLWLPFVKAILKELNDALVDEGGLFGRPPTEIELRAVRKDPNLSPSPLQSRDRDPDDPTRARGGEQGAGRRPGASAPSTATSRRSAGSAPQSGFSRPRATRGFARHDRPGA